MCIIGGELEVDFVVMDYGDFLFGFDYIVFGDCKFGDYVVDVGMGWDCVFCFDLIVNGFLFGYVGWL